MYPRAPRKPCAVSWMRAALSADLAPASGAYFDNDAGRLADPLPDALSPSKCAALLSTLADLVER